MNIRRHVSSIPSGVAPQRRSAALRSATAIEYALLVGFVAALASVSVGSVGTRISGAFSAAAEKVVAASATAAAGVIEAGKEALFYLTGSTLSPVDNATALSVDFSSLNFLHVENITPADLTWSVGNSPLPPGLTLDPALGVLSGAIPTKGSYEFEIVASRDSEESRATYSIDVNGVRLAVTAVSTSRNNSCAILAADGSVVCWGDGSSGKLGDGRTVASAVPVAVIGLGPGVQQISAGVFHTCAIDAAGAAKCWGSGTEGRLGNGSTSDSSTPVQVSGLTSGVRSIATGASHTCAIDAAGAAKCWGVGADGRLGNGSQSNSLTPVQVSDLTSGVRSIAAGGEHTCAIDAAGAAKCWGGAGLGELGDGSLSNSLTPVQVSGLTSGVRSISTGWNHTCAIDTVGAAKCWGRGDEGQLGNGSQSTLSTPAQVSGLTSGVQSISAGLGAHTCAIDAAGAAKCWGAGNYGQIGNGSTSGSLTPVQVSGLTSGVRSIAAGAVHTCAIDADGAAKCWGWGEFGQRGDGKTTPAVSLPTDVLVPAGG